MKITNVRTAVTIKWSEPITTVGFDTRLEPCVAVWVILIDLVPHTIKPYFSS